MSKETIDNVQCPACHSISIYRDGKARTGNQRYLCMMCGMQFTISHRTRVKERPLCLTCGQPMHLYRQEQTLVRFRCSSFPTCRTYVKVLKG